MLRSTYRLFGLLVWSVEHVRVEAEEVELDEESIELEEQIPLGFPRVAGD